MPRVLGIDIPGRKKLEFSLRYIYGIGPTTAVEICEKAKLDRNMKADDLKDEDIQRLVAVLQSDYRIEGDLRREISANIRRLISVGSYRGRRHRAGLPVRGQRTKTNARTRKGAKRTVGVVRGKEARSAAKAAK
ncbi:30S ribosomal protein S13 [Pontiella agarivorans]|uniref:Small ribosomal subunit protein uS13 n=1 Tax=Pontiella agarivorans TaxID=3038953 RepID=A0ABU5MZQ7_9BACT|nr:30S ribosomal protein S13 [Pontiella agarivorans]MDZ8119643.1 30S ribosomal protein S13 [Pontiella agarivorans]